MNVPRSWIVPGPASCQFMFMVWIPHGWHALNSELMCSFPLFCINKPYGRNARVQRAQLVCIGFSIIACLLVMLYDALVRWSMLKKYDTGDLGEGFYLSGLVHSVLRLYRKSWKTSEAQYITPDRVRRGGAPGAGSAGPSLPNAPAAAAIAGTASATTAGTRLGSLISRRSTTGITRAAGTAAPPSSSRME
jgi:hypothetical protein